MRPSNAKKKFLYNKGFAFFASYKDNVAKTVKGKYYHDEFQRKARGS